MIKSIKDLLAVLVLGVIALFAVYFFTFAISCAWRSGEIAAIKSAIPNFQAEVINGKKND